LTLRLQGAMLRFAVGLKAKTGACALQVYPPKTPKMSHFGENDPFPKKFRNFVPKVFMTTSIHVLCSNFM